MRFERGVPAEHVVKARQQHGGLNRKAGSAGQIELLKEIEEFLMCITNTVKKKHQIQVLAIFAALIAEGTQFLGDLVLSQRLGFNARWSYRDFSAMQFSDGLVAVIVLSCSAHEK